MILNAFDVLATFQSVMKILPYITKNKQYIFLYAFLFLLVISSWYLFFFLNLIEGIALQITAIISYLGFGFALFQFWFNHITTEKRRIYDMRYSGYKEVISLIDAITETLNEEMSNSRIVEVYSILGKLTNQINKLASTLNEFNQYLFPKINETNESKLIQDLMEKIIRRTDKYRHELEREIKLGNPDGNNFLETIHSMNWHNDIIKYLKELHENKYSFYRRLREHIE